MGVILPACQSPICLHKQKSLVPFEIHQVSKTSTQDLQMREGDCGRGTFCEERDGDVVGWPKASKMAVSGHSYMDIYVGWSKRC